MLWLAIEDEEVLCNICIGSLKKGEPVRSAIACFHNHIYPSQQGEYRGKMLPGISVSDD
jgi:hypothetical protein